VQLARQARLFLFADTLIRWRDSTDSCSVRSATIDSSVLVGVLQRALATTRA
jgi:hypothetical protein